MLTPSSCWKLAMPTHCVGFGENSRWLVKLNPKASANGTMMKSRIRPTAGAAIAQPARFEDSSRVFVAAMGPSPDKGGWVRPPWEEGGPDQRVNRRLKPS